MAIERIGEIKGLLVVGKYYLVPCMRVRYERGNEIDWLVIGPEHSDAEYLNFHYQHYHFDVRFVSKSVFESQLKIGIGPYALAAVLHTGRHRSRNEMVIGPFEKRRKCLRLMPEFPIYGPVFPKPKLNASWMPDLEAAYKDCTIKADCLRCPHRGLPLNGPPVDEQGNVVCPGHGLRFNLHAGRLVPRT
jgi:hypothetical protein